MVVKVMLILGLILLGTCLAYVYPRRDQHAEDDEWEVTPPQRLMDEPARVSESGYPDSFSANVGRNDCDVIRFVASLSLTALNTLVLRRGGRQHRHAYKSAPILEVSAWVSWTYGRRRRPSFDGRVFGFVERR